MAIIRNLAGIIDFDSAARWSSFRLAAQELNKTPAAISQQIKQLEATIGFPLFTRHPRQVTLTARGQALAKTVSDLLAELNATVSSLQTNDDEHVLTVSTTHSFALKWLAFRLQRFSVKHPAIDIRLDASDVPVDLRSGHCDLAIRYARWEDSGDPQWLFRDRRVVVYSPTLCGTPGHSLEGLARLPLLSEESTSDWLTLLRASKINRKYFDFSNSYSHAGLLVQAAVAGHGVAIVPLAIAYDDLVGGRLLCADIDSMPSNYGYRLIYAPAKSSLAKVRAFETWIREEITEMLQLIDTLAQ